MVQHHDLVNHGQLQVRVRIVERHAGVLGQKDDEPARDDEHQRRTGAMPGRGIHIEEIGERQSTGDAGQGQEAEEERRLRERAERELACHPHPFERRAGVECGRRRAEPREREEVDEDDQVACERHRRTRACQWQQQRGQQGNDDRDSRTGQEDPGRRAAEHRFLSQELSDVVVRLQERRPTAAGEDRLGPDDDAQKKRRGNEDEQSLQDGVHRALQASNATSVAPR